MAWCSKWVHGDEFPDGVEVTLGRDGNVRRYVPERTCRMRLRDDIRSPAYRDTYSCDACGEEVERCTVMGESEPPNYCPNCGRKVVEG